MWDLGRSRLGFGCLELRNGIQFYSKASLEILEIRSNSFFLFKVEMSERKFQNFIKIYLSESLFDFHNISSELLYFLILLSLIPFGIINVVIRCLFIYFRCIYHILNNLLKICYLRFRSGVESLTNHKVILIFMSQVVSLSLNFFTLA